MDCLKNIVGISNMDCICLTEGLTPEQIELAKKSTSGLYLDQNLDGMIKLNEIKTLDSCGEYYRLARESIEAAERSFFDDVVIGLSSKYKAVKPRFVGELGRLQYGSFITSNKNIQYLRIEPVGIGSATMQVDNLRINISENKNTVIKMIAVVDGLTSGDEVFTTNVQTQANKWVNVSVPENIKLPLSKNGNKLIYYLVWEKTGTETSVDNGISCGCSGGDSYSGYVSLSGGESDSYDNLTNGNSKLANGLSVGVQIYCETASVLCSQVKDYENVFKVSSWSILFKSGEILINKILSSQEIKRFTMMNRDVMYAMRDHFSKEYGNRIAFLLGEMEIKNSDCFSCSNKTMYVGNIYS